MNGLNEVCSGVWGTSKHGEKTVVVQKLLHSDVEDMVVDVDTSRCTSAANDGAGTTIERYVLGQLFRMLSQPRTAGPIGYLHILVSAK